MNFSQVIEDISRKAEDQIMEMYNQLVNQFGDKPIGFTEGDTLEKLDNYLYMRDNQKLWEQWIQEEAQVDGLEAAKSNAIKQAAEFERLLKNNGGAIEVRKRMLERHLRESDKLNAKQKPPLESLYTIVEPEPQIDDMQLLSELVGEMNAE